jgi:arginase family enzyme
MARGVGREGVSAEEGAGMRLFAKQLLYDAKRGLPEFSLISGEGVGEQEEEVTVRHEMEYRKLVDRQRVEEEEEKSKAEVRSIERLTHAVVVGGFARVQIISGEHSIEHASLAAMIAANPKS